MSRPPRSLVVVPGMPHHVIVRGNNRRRICSYASCYLQLAALIQAASRKHEVPVHAFAFMGNHAHLVVTPECVKSLADFVKSFSQRYAARRNRSRGASGKLFEQRYVAVPITSEAQLALTLAYVDLNPVRARLAGDPSQYPWSSYRCHVPRRRPGSLDTLWTPHDWYLGLASSPSRRSELYAEWVATRDEEALERIAAETSDRDDEAEEYGHRPLRPDGSGVREPVSERLSDTTQN